MDVFTPGDHGSTFGGNPLGAAVGMASLEVIVDEQLAERSERLGEALMSKIRDLDSPHVADVRGAGLLVGVEIHSASGPARPFCEKLMGLGLLCKETHEQVIRLAPPLNIEEEDLDYAIELLGAVLV